jgi:hypothetical protein
MTTNCYNSMAAARRLGDNPVTKPDANQTVAVLAVGKTAEKMGKIMDTALRRGAATAVLQRFQFV